MPRRHILLLTARPEAHQLLVDALADAGHEVEVSPAPTGYRSPDLAIVDLVGEDRWDQARLYSTGRLILLVAEASDMQRGFELGADDCAVAGTPVEEIVARCEASLRRTAVPEGSSPDASATIYADSRVWVNFELRQAWAGGHSAHLTGREHSLLRFLIANADHPVTAASILEHVWHRDADQQSDEVLKQYIWRLRQKLEPNPNRPQIIITVPGKGYQFVRHRP